MPAARKCSESESYRFDTALGVTWHSACRLADKASAKEAYDSINGVHPSKTEFDQWEAQILARILTKCTVILVSKHCDPQMIKDMHINHAFTLEEAMEKAEAIMGKDSKITVIPDGIAVIVK